MNDTQPQPAEAGLSVVAITNVLLRHRRFLVALAVGVALATLTFQLARPRQYTVAASFIIRSNNTGGAAGLAAQLGVEVGGVDVSQSPEFYATLVRTPDVLARLADTTFSTGVNPKPKTLAEIWGVSYPDAKRTRDEVLRKLMVAISSSVGSRLDVVSVTVTSSDPVLSKGVADAILVQLNRFNLQTLQSRASAERKFAEGRMNEVQGELRVAEAGLQRFLEDNRQQYLSPALEIEKGRLGRKVDLLQQTYTTLATSYERARIDEVRDTPLITIIQKPAVPIRPDSRGTVGKTILMILMGLFVGSLLVLTREAFNWMRSSGEADAAEFNRLVSAASQDVVRLRSVLRSLPRRRAKEEHFPS